MPKLGMEPIRRDALVKATIAEVGLGGTLDVTVAQIARRAGMSSALAHHYFGGKEQMLLGAMRHVLRLYAGEVRSALARADATPRARLDAIIRANFAPANFRREVVGAWLQFYVLAQTVPGARRLLRIYQGRLRSNLVHALRPLAAGAAPDLADEIGALIDGVYLREALSPMPPDGEHAARLVARHVDRALTARLTTPSADDRRTPCDMDN